MSMRRSRAQQSVGEKPRSRFASGELAIVPSDWNKSADQGNAARSFGVMCNSTRSVSDPTPKPQVYRNTYGARLSIGLAQLLLQRLPGRRPGCDAHVRMSRMN
jgi:hypothetical protein